MMERWRSCAGLLLWAALSSAGDQFPEFELKAQMISTLPVFTRWPSQAPANDSSRPFVFLVLGKHPFGSTLDSVLGPKLCRGKHFKLVYASELTPGLEPDLVYIGPSEKARLGELLKALKAKSVVTIGDSEGYGRAGVVYNFFIEGRSVRLEVNLPAAQEAGLNISSQLLSISRVLP